MVAKAIKTLQIIIFFFIEYFTFHTKLPTTTSSGGLILALIRALTLLA